MATSSLPYDHTLKRFWAGENPPGSVFRINLYSSFTFDPTAETKAEAEVGCVQLDSEYGYVQDSKVLANVVVNQNGNDCFFDADDVAWLASGSNLVATHAMIYNDSAPGDPPVVAFDLDGPVTAPDGSSFQLIWNAAGIIVVETGS